MNHAEINIKLNDLEAERQRLLDLEIFRGPGSDRHWEWKAAIERREAIAELEQQLKMLHALIERQANSAYAELCREIGG
jgi:hypothetical protein